jgi:hypothetical protein
MHRNIHSTGIVVSKTEGQELTLILIGYYEPSGSTEDTPMLCSRAMITVVLKRIAGAYERIGIINPYEGGEADKWLNQRFQGAKEHEIKIV